MHPSAGDCEGGAEGDAVCGEADGAAWMVGGCVAGVGRRVVGGSVGAVPVGAPVAASGVVVASLGDSLDRTPASEPDPLPSEPTKSGGAVPGRCPNGAVV